MRASKASSAFSPATAYAGTPAWRARVAISNVALPSSVRSCSAPRRQHHRARAAHARVEVQRVEQPAHVRSRSAPGRARTGPQRAARPPAGRGPALRARARSRGSRPKLRREQQPLGTRGALIRRGPRPGRHAQRSGGSWRDHDRASFQQWPPAKGEHVIVEVCGHEVRVSNPGKLFFPERRPHQARPRQLLPRVRAGGRAPPARAPDRDEALGRRRRGRAVLPEARARQRARVAADGHRHVPERPPRARARAQRRRPPRVGRRTSA